MLKMIVLGFLGIGVALAVYVRLAPSDPAVWHVAPPPTGPGVRETPGGYQVVRAVDAPTDALAALDIIIMADPNTQRLAGSVDAGRITYITRSALWGFPDYTTVDVVTDDTGASTIAVYGRLRFGQSDTGVNKARIEGWMAAFGQDTPAQ